MSGDSAHHAADADGRRPRVVILRGHQANPWELGPWSAPPVAERYDVVYARSHRGWFDSGAIELAPRRAWTLRDLLPAGPLGDLAVRLPGDRYLGLGRVIRGADIVHTQELGYWYSAQAARLKRRFGYRLVTTVWETIPLLDAYRNIRTRPYRAVVLRETDLFLAATERARIALLLEGAAPERILVCPPGVVAIPRVHDGVTDRSAEALVLSPGRLVWEKGHQDVMRAAALLERGFAGPPLSVRVVIVGRGPDEARLRSYAHDLGLQDRVEFRGMIPYEQMLGLYAQATCVVLASLPTWSWEEQFGMVLAEAMQAGRPIIASSSGAIPEVAGSSARYFSPGDWPGLARLIGALIGGESDGGTELVGDAARYTIDAAAARIAGAYETVLGQAME
ncbi:MAG: glycosyltransferase family 4 protein [Solirubrobacteraceae bacterium]|jgi:glycosyltransferase involved in cell wall biosynthesis